MEFSHLYSAQASGPCFEDLVNGIDYILKLYRGHRAVEDLKTFSDEQLCDLGLTRQDILSADMDPCFKDPTCRLRDRVNDRRRIQFKIQDSS